MLKWRKGAEAAVRVVGSPMGLPYGRRNATLARMHPGGQVPAKRDLGVNAPRRGGHRPPAGQSCAGKMNTTVNQGGETHDFAQTAV